MTTKSSGEKIKQTEPTKLGFLQRGNYDLTAEAYLWHPDPAINRMWARQHEEANRK